MDDYKNKKIPKSRFSVININQTEPIPDEIKDQGVVYVPYMMVEHTSKSSKEYDEFMTEYKKQHKCCPKCGAEGHTSTLVGYCLNMDKKEEYKDKNSCKCTSCGDVHITHDRVPKKNEKL